MPVVDLRNWRWSRASWLLRTVDETRQEPRREAPSPAPGGARGTGRGPPEVGLTYRGKEMVVQSGIYDVSPEEIAALVRN